MTASRERAGVRDTLSDAKRALLEQRLRGSGPASGGTEIPHRPGSAPVVLTQGQLRLWFLHQLAPASAAYTMFDARRLRGPLDPVALYASIADVVLRHEVLRTRYETREGRPVAVVEPAAAFGFETVALDAGEGAAGEDRAREHANAFIRRPFELEAGPVLRVALLRLASQDHVLVLAVHHIACDEWSLDVLWRELAANYVTRCSGGAVPRAGPALQYADFAHWQQERRAGPDAAEHLAYWRDVLEGRCAALELQPDRVPPVRRSFRGGVVSAHLDPDVADSLASLARAAGTTDFVLHLAAFLVLLHRYTGETDLVVGVPVTGRSHPALESVVGFFLNTLPLRTDLSGDPSFRHLLRRTHDAFMSAVPHRDAPFEAIVDAVAPERSLNRNPLFSVMFVEQNGAAPLSFGEGVAVGRFPLDAGGSKFDVTLFVGRSGDGLDTTIEYDADRFDRSTAVRMLGQFRTLLGGIAGDPDRAISALPLASPEEREQVDAWSRGPAIRADEPVHGTFRRLVRSVPRSVAISTDDGSLSYERLGARVLQLARRLRDHGIGTDERVGLCAHRSADMVAGMLAILEAGAAYVPLDPAYPPDRLDFAIRDSGARTVLAAGEHVARVSASGAAILVIESDEVFRDDLADVPFPTAASLAGTAYVLHTSGSTGAPKGVVVTQRNLAYSTAARSALYTEPPGVFLLLPSFAFDSSVAGIFWTLTTGGTLALPPHHIEQDVHALAAFIARHAVTHTLCLPSLWETILEHAPADLLRSLRTVIVAGEACTGATVRRHYTTLPDVALWNEYGPTEATVWSTAFAIPRCFDGARVPIGRPIAGTRVRVLEPGGGPAPIGVPGEICIGGAGVAGYLNRPEESALRFVADPFSDDAAGRLYRTGDRARWRESGDLEFMGRMDQQVKVRGYRIEPGEIESVLRQHRTVRDAVVAVRALGREAPDAAIDATRLVEALSAMDARAADRLLAVVESASAPEPTP